MLTTPEFADRPSSKRRWVLILLVLLVAFFGFMYWIAFWIPRENMRVLLSDPVMKQSGLIQVGPDKREDPSEFFADTSKAVLERTFHLPKSQLTQAGFYRHWVAFLLKNGWDLERLCVRYGSSKREDPVVDGRRFGSDGRGQLLKVWPDFDKRLVFVTLDGGHKNYPAFVGSKDPSVELFNLTGKITCNGVSAFLP